MKRNVAIVQARMGSTRLPGKVCKLLFGQTMLSWCIDRLKRSRYLDEVVVATTLSKNDDVICSLCNEEGYTCFRGDEFDVLDRYYQAALFHEADTIVRVTSDCPLVDPQLVDFALLSYHCCEPSVDYMSNCFPRTYPRGFDLEVFSFKALERAWNEAFEPSHREHVTPYLYAEKSSFTRGNFENNLDFSDLRLTVDTPEDFSLISSVFEAFGHGDFSWQDVVAFLKDKPELMKINSHVEQKAL